ncbi:hypothetical protein HK098_006721 [Nowakowskiella sp. JEL0407]|nr:hypothetical protein HK098_006721 [Nowakowskiella sp. JEL0407]
MQKDPDFFQSKSRRSFSNDQINGNELHVKPQHQQHHHHHSAVGSGHPMHQYPEDYQSHHRNNGQIGMHTHQHQYHWRPPPMNDMYRNHQYPPSEHYSNGYANSSLPPLYRPYGGGMGYPGQQPPHNFEDHRMYPNDPHRFQSLPMYPPLPPSPHPQYQLQYHNYPIQQPNVTSGINDIGLSEFKSVTATADQKILMFCDNIQVFARRMQISANESRKLPVEEYVEAHHQGSKLLQILSDLKAVVVTGGSDEVVTKHNSESTRAKYKKRNRSTSGPGKCRSCDAVETPEWRRGPEGARTLCNACGLHYAKLNRKRQKETDLKQIDEKELSSDSPSTLVDSPQNANQTKETNTEKVLTVEEDSRVEVEVAD